jgi:hypothetical protein
LFADINEMPKEPIIKIFSKINFTAFPMELRNKILRMDVVFGELSFGHIIGRSEPQTILA